MCTLYTTESCPKCSIIKRKLDNASIPYHVNNDINIMQTKHIRSVPALELDGDLYTDFVQINKLICEMSVPLNVAMA